MKKKSILFLVSFPFVCFVSFIFYIYVSSFVNEYKTYYFPEIKTYIKIYKPLFNEYGYVLFSKDSVFTFSEDIDYVKVYKSETSGVNFIFNPIKSNSVYVFDRWNNIELNEVEFTLTKLSRTDTAFYDQSMISGISTHILKPQYFGIYVEGFLQSVFYTNNNGIEEYPIKATPLSNFD